MVSGISHSVSEACYRHVNLGITIKKIAEMYQKLGLRVDSRNSLKWNKTKIIQKKAGKGEAHRSTQAEQETSSEMKGPGQTPTTGYEVLNTQHLQGRQTVNCTNGNNKNKRTQSSPTLTTETQADKSLRDKIAVSAVNDKCTQQWTWTSQHDRPRPNPPNKSP